MIRFLFDFPVRFANVILFLSFFPVPALALAASIAPSSRLRAAICCAIVLTRSND